MLELSVSGSSMTLLRKWAQQGRITQSQMFRRGVAALGAVLAVAPVAVVGDSLPAAPAGAASTANSSTTLSMAVLVGSSSPTFRAKVIGVPSGTAAPTGSVSFAVNGFGPLQCDGLSDTVSMSGGVATGKVTSALPASGSPETAQATYSGDGTFTASAGTLTASSGTFHPNDGNPAPVVPLVVTPPASIPDDCSSDAAPALLSWLSSLPPGTASKPVVVKLPALACYAVNESLHLQNTTNLTIDGDGSTIVQPVAADFMTLQPPTASAVTNRSIPTSPSRGRHSPTPVITASRSSRPRV